MPKHADRNTLISYLTPCVLIVLIVACAGQQDQNSVKVQAAGQGSSTAMNQMNQVNPETNGAVKAGADNLVAQATSSLNKKVEQDPTSKAANLAAAQLISQVETNLVSSTSPSVPLAPTDPVPADPTPAGATTGATTGAIESDPSAAPSVTPSATTSAQPQLVLSFLNGPTAVSFSGPLSSTASTFLKSSDNVYQAKYTCKDTGAAVSSNGECEAAVLDLSINSSGSTTATGPMVRSIIRHTALKITVDVDPNQPATTQFSSNYNSLKQMIMQTNEEDPTKNGVAFGWMDSSEVIHGPTSVRILFALDNGHLGYEQVNLVGKSITASTVTAAQASTLTAPLQVDNNQDELNRRFPQPAHVLFQNLQKSLAQHPPVISSINNGTEFKVVIYTAPNEIMTLKMTRVFKNMPTQRPRNPRNPPQQRPGGRGHDEQIPLTDALDGADQTTLPTQTTIPTNPTAQQ
jgi:hypothetical protein